MKSRFCLMAREKKPGFCEIFFKTDHFHFESESIVRFRTSQVSKSDRGGHSFWNLRQLVYGFADFCGFRENWAELRTDHFRAAGTGVLSFEAGIAPELSEDFDSASQGSR